MPRRETYDGAHTVFTDHQIARGIARAAKEPSEQASDNYLVAWRQAPSSFVDRNLALAYLSVGVQRRSPAMIVRAYQMFTNLQQTFASDPALFNGIGTALLLGGKSDEARFAFERVLQLQPGDSAAEENLARAYLASKDTEQAIVHLQKAVEQDPLSLPAVELLEDLYSQTGESAKRSQLEERVRRALTQ
jgi:tetratricopeptide (TPR) repeat protein